MSIYRNLCESERAEIDAMKARIAELEAGFRMLMNIADELDQPAPRPLLADAEVGWVCQLKNGKWVTITHRMPIRTSDGLWYKLDGTEDTIPMEKHIISCEPLAPEGTAEWALQQMKLGKTVCHPIDDKPHRCRITDDKIVCDYCGQVFDIAKWTSGCLQPSGWCIYEPAKSEPAPFAVGDWVAYCVNGVLYHSKIYGVPFDNIVVVASREKGLPSVANILTQQITRKLDPSEVRVKITLEGTVNKICGNNLAFELEDDNGVVTVIGYQQLDPDTAKLVRELAGK